jgi:hypothetical protein
MEFSLFGKSLDTLDYDRNPFSNKFKKNSIMKLTNKTALITGGNSGIGLATAQRFVAEGPDVSSPGAARRNWTRRSRRLGPT